MSNKVDYIYCSSCGYEGIDDTAAFSRTTAGNGDKGEDWYFCPSCSQETSNVDVEDY